MNWVSKIRAFLHDPPHKQWVMFVDKKNHEKVADELFVKLFPNFSVSNLEILKEADIISSAFSRTIFAPLEANYKEKFREESIVSWDEMFFIDFFSLEKHSLLEVETSSIYNVFEILSQKLTQTELDEKAKFYYLFLWRFLPIIFPWIGTHPADSRAPNHSIYDHLTQTSAVATALPNPSFLIFSIAPVQSFISKARKTQDLWAGSYLLSFLIWQAIQSIVDSYGPSSVIYPNLFEQPFMDCYLQNLEFHSNAKVEKPFKELNNFLEIKDNQKFRLKVSTEELLISNIPHKFLALLPTDRNIAQECENKIWKEIDNIAKWSSDHISKLIDFTGNNTKIYHKIHQHLHLHFKFYWTILPWLNEDAMDDHFGNILRNYKEIVGENSKFKIVDKILKNPIYKNSSMGTLYPLLIDLAEKLFASRKSIREFKPFEEEGHKCTLCGEFNQLWLLDKDFNWSDYSKNNEKWRKIWETSKLVGKNERLCGVCLAKRLFPSYLKEKFHILNNEDISFPSTEEISSISLKMKMSNELKQEFFYLLKETGLLKILPRTKSVRVLKGDPLEKIDGQWLKIDSYSSEYIDEQIGSDALNFEEIVKIKHFLGEKKIAPSNYYAVVKVDGDRMGQWIKGEFNNTTEAVTHPKFINKLKEYTSSNYISDLQEILQSKHPITPTLHQIFSRQISYFAVNDSIDIIENRNPGKLVYAGGDDILALLPVEFALSSCMELQEKFKSRLSPKATMSAGVVFAHCKYPLQLVLKEVDEAEKVAKNTYERDAYCIRLLTRSGEYRQTGGKWRYYLFLKEIIDSFYNENLPSNLPYQLFELIRKIFGNEDMIVNKNNREFSIIESEIKRICKRKKLEEKPILTLYESFEYSYFDFANLLLIARFIAQQKPR